MMYTRELGYNSFGSAKLVYELNIGLRLKNGKKLVRYNREFVITHFVMAKFYNSSYNWERVGKSKIRTSKVQKLIKNLKRIRNLKV